MNKKRNNKILLFTCFLILTMGVSSYSQITILPPNLGFSQACASSGYNTYELTFSFYPVQNLGPNNEFIIELSDASGSFTAPTTVATLTNSASPVSEDFALPDDTAGENYRIRVRSTDPVQTSNPSTYFSAYYAIHNQPYSINNYNSEVNLCDGESFLLEIDDTGTPASPVYYPFLSYIWYKDFIEIPNENGPTLLVTEPGSYYVITDYGSCVMNSYSNIVNVDIATTINATISTDDGDTTICLPQSKTLVSDNQASSYQYTWFKDGQPLSNSNAPTYEATEEGNYYVEIDDLGCTFISNSIYLTVGGFQVTLDNNQDQMLIPGESLTVAATTTAQTYTTQWYKDGTAITGENQLELTITQPGTYKIIVSQSAPCATDKEASVTIVFPDYFNLAVDTDVLYEACTSTSTNIKITQFEAVSTLETVDLLGTSPNFDYQWFKDSSLLTGATADLYSVSDASENGAYKMEVTVPNYGTISSNIVAVNLEIDEVNITNDGPLCDRSSTNLSSNITDASYSYQWYQDGSPIAGATTDTYTVVDEDDYFLKVSSGTCTQQSNIITIEEEEITVSSSNPNTDIILPGETKALLVTTDASQPTYQWYRNSVLINGATNNNYSATQDGDYKVEVTQTNGCIIEEELIFTLEYPLGFTIVIGPSSDYVACSSTSTQLNLTEFTAQTSNGPVDLLNNNYGYDYQWFKNNTVISGATVNSYSVSDASENGNYKMEVTIPDFGAISSNTLPINLGIGTISITNDGPLCSGQSTNLNSTITDASYSYQWYQDGNPITGATSSTYTTADEGDYFLEISSGTCTQQSNTLTLEYGQISITSNNPTTDVIVPGETKQLQVTTNAMQPTYQWYKNGVLIPAATNNTYNATEDGDYKIVVKQTINCTIEEELNLTLEYPIGFTIVTNPSSDYIECISVSTQLTITEFFAQTNSGDIDILNNTYGYDYQWFKDNSVINGATNTAYTVTDNGTYFLEVTIPGFAVVSSNATSINLALENIVIENQNPICPGEPTIITSNVTGAGNSYQWFKDGNAISGATSESFTATQEGIYLLEVESGTCSAQSNELTLTYGEISINSMTPDTNLLLPGETKSIQISTDAQQPTFVWYKDGVLIPNANSSSLTVTEAGVYKIIVTQTQGCLLEAEKEFTFSSPTGYNIAIEKDPDYNECTSESLDINLTVFEAVTPNGNIDVLNDPSISYTAQWYKDGTAVTNATQNSITLTDASQNGVYKLALTIVDYGVVESNDIIANLDVNTPLVITTDGLLCENNPEVDINSSIVDPSYSYSWFKDGTLIETNNQATITITTEGNYSLTLDTGSCSKESNTLVIEESTINIEPNAPLSSTLIPGSTMDLSVSSNAMQPNYNWYKDNTLINGETTNAITIDQAGSYKVVVTQTIGCILEKELSFTVQYPESFTLVIAPDANYNDCESTSTTLSVSAFYAETEEGNIDLLNNPYRYDFQWYKDDALMVGKTEMTLTVDDYTKNGTYSLEVIIPDFDIVFSNALDIQLAFIDSLTIESEGILCESDSEVRLYSDVTAPQYDYAWYAVGANTVLGTEPELLVQEEGSYYLVVSFEGCDITSNTETITTLDSSIVTLDYPEEIELLEGTTVTVTTNGADSYTWYLGSEVVSTTAEIEITTPGTYILIAVVGNCEVSKEITVTEMENPAVAIPNVVTLNGDGINEHWGLPKKYVGKENIEVIIYGPDGLVVFRDQNYMNTWPQSSFEFSKKQSVYYYTILEDNVITKKGSITIIK